MKYTRWSCVPLLLALLLAPSMQQQTRTQLDVVFVMDSSDSLGQANFNLLRSAILNYITPQMDGSALHVGFVQYATNLNAIVNLTPDVTAFRNSVNALQYTGGETNTNIGVQWGLSVLMTSSTRPGIPQVMIVIVDGVSRFPDQTQIIADFSRGMGVEIYALGIGSSVTQEELLSIAGDASRVVTSNSFSVLPNIDLQLDTGSVTVTVPTTLPTTPTTRPTTPTTPSTTPTTRPTTPTTRPTTPTTRPTTPTTRPTTPTTRPTTPTTRPTTPITRPPTTTTRPTTAQTRRTSATTTTTRRTPVFTTTTARRPDTTTRGDLPSTTTRRAPVTPYVEPFLDAGLCEDAEVIDGIGYRAHPYEADKYVQCYFPSESRTLAVIRECPFGLLWNAKALICDLHLRVSLRGDRCRSGRLRAYPHEGNCRTFYHCQGGRSVPRCCPQGYLFDPISQGCNPCPGCRDPCPSMCPTVKVACNKYPVFGDMTVYRKWTRDGDVIVPCQNRTFFDLAACECTAYNAPAVCEAGVDVPFRSQVGQDVLEMSYEDVRLVSNSGIFDGSKSRVRVPTTPASPYDKPLVMRLTYREAEEVKESRALASSGDCGLGGLFLVSLERNNIKVQMSSYGRTPIIFRLPTAGFNTSDIKDVVLYHDRDHLTGVVMSGNLVYLTRAKVAVLPYLQCGLDFGNSDWMRGFNGTMTRIQLRRCYPDDFVLG